MFSTCVDPLLLETLGALVVILYIAVILRVLFGRTKHTADEPVYGASAMRPPVPKPIDRRPSHNACCGCDKHNR